MSIEQLPSGGMVITGEHIELYRLLSLRGRLQLEIKGIRFSQSTSAALKKLYGWKGNKEKILEQLEERIRTQFPGALA